MQLFAFILAVIALLVFIATAMDVPKSWANVAAGLSFLTAALIVQFVVATGYRVTVS